MTDLSASVRRRLFRNLSLYMLRHYHDDIPGYKMFNNWCNEYHQYISDPEWVVYLIEWFERTKDMDYSNILANAYEDHFISTSEYENLKLQHPQSYITSL